MIDPGHLRTLEALHRTGSVSGAANDLGYTPSAVSQQIKRLERQLDAPVLERVGRGVMLTELGRYLADEGLDVLRRLERLNATAAQIHGEPTGTLTLLTFPTAARGLVAPALPELAARAPELTIKLIEVGPQEAIEAVASGAADAALVHTWGEMLLAIPDHLEQHLLGIDKAEVLVHRDHRLAAIPRLATEDLDDVVWVSAAQGSVCHSWLLHLYALRHRQPEIRYLAGEFSTHVALVGHGLCVALVPRLGRETLPDDVRAVPLLGTNANRRVSLIWRRSMAPSPAIITVREALTAQARISLEAPGQP